MFTGLLSPGSMLDDQPLSAFSVSRAGHGPAQVTGEVV